MPLLRSSTIKFNRGQYKTSGIPTINYDHNLARGLLFYAFDTGLGLVIDLVTGAFGTQVATPASFNCPYGAAFLNTTSRVTFPSTDAIRTATGAPPYSFATAFFQTAAALQNAAIFGRLANAGSSQPFWNWNFSVNNTGAVPWNDFGQLNNNGIIGGAIFSGDSAGNSFKSLAGVASPSSFSCYKNGLLLGTASVTPKNNSVTDTILLGGDGISGNIAAFYGAFWNRALTTQEILQLHFDPYGFLIFPQDKIGHRLSAIRTAPLAARTSAFSASRSPLSATAAVTARSHNSLSSRAPSNGAAFLTARSQAMARLQGVRKGVAGLTSLSRFAVRLRGLLGDTSPPVFGGAVSVSDEIVYSVSLSEEPMN